MMIRYVPLLSILVVFAVAAETSSSSSVSFGCRQSNDNPNGDIPMVNAPIELVGLWEGSNCGVDDPAYLLNFTNKASITPPVPGTLVMDEDGVNVWSFADAKTGRLVSQTGDGVEVIVGWQCVDVGRGYWWGQTLDSDHLWCNLYDVQVIESSSPDNQNTNNTTTLVSYVNLAHGAEFPGACPTTLTTNPLFEPLQASFKQIYATNFDYAMMTCNVPAGSKDKVQPSCNSQFPSDVEIPNPFVGSGSSSSSSLPVFDQITCEPLDSVQSTAILIRVNIKVMISMAFAVWMTAI